MPKLYAGRFNGAYTSGEMLENFGEPVRLGLRWSLDAYGPERIEVTVKAKSQLDVYDRMNSHFGGVGERVHRIGIFDDMVYNVFSGQIVGIRPEGNNQVTYVTRGPGWLFDSPGGPTTLLTPTDTITDQLKNFLADDTQDISDDVSGVEDSSTLLGGWQPTQPYPALGSSTREFVEFAKKSSSSNGELWDFYVVDEPMVWGELGDFKAYFRNRGNRTTVDWKVQRKDLSRLELDRGIYDFRSAATVYYGTYEGTATGGSSTSLVDSGASFLDGSISVGDLVRNITDGSEARIREIVSATTLNLSTLTGGSGNNFAASDDYSIKSDKKFNSETSNTGIFNILQRILIEHHPELNSTQADQYADALENFYNTPVQSAAFTVSSPWIRDANGAKRPLWAPIFEGGGLIQITDLYPAAAVSLTNDGTNNLDTFFITAMDYDYTSNQLRVAVNVPDSRLDARLAANGILGSAGIARGMR